ncbi:hypothetical protein EBZ39_15300 [bacterium]|nr:hypothetical protein [bacterium]
METIIAITTFALLAVLFGVLGIYSRMGSNDDILAEQFNSDFAVTKNLMDSCTKRDAAKLIDAFYDRWAGLDAAKLIDAFYDRWAGLVPEWTICAHVMELRHHLDYQHRNIKDIIYSKPISKN